MIFSIQQFTIENKNLCKKLNSIQQCKLIIAVLHQHACNTLACNILFDFNKSVTTLQLGNVQNVLRMNDSQNHKYKRAHKQLKSVNCSKAEIAALSEINGAFWRYCQIQEYELVQV
ncbi:Hypothetical_protein [Hexamita inflata]|uniref:Hypothetical_protein n=1 Tax=Hexamita inflata TaxID=28002 RepID=A0AA86RGQ3_9EUKA|nr:Hypothetical protein HINF_LOCUS63852 [Hexamita inflata]